jgi:hypothetical protein
VVSRWLTLAAVVLAATLSFGAASAQSSTPSDGAETVVGRVGISSSTIWLHPSEGYAYLAAARAGGVTWIREDFAWSNIEPQHGRFSWTRTDVLMRNAARLGVHVLPMAGYSPGWASGHPESDKYPPTRPQDYAAFVTAVADRYGIGGTFWRANPRLPRVPVTAIELWNEPWLSSLWRPAPDPAAYARLVRSAATAVKARRPRMILIASADLQREGAAIGSPDWLAPMLAADPALWRSKLVDAWSVHLYCQERSPLDTTSPQQIRFDRLLLTRTLTQRAGADKPIWITEFGWNTNPAKADSVNEGQQAQYVHDALVRVNTEWSSLVRRSFVYTWTKPSVDPDYNLLRLDGSPRPAWGVIQQFLASRR